MKDHRRRISNGRRRVIEYQPKMWVPEDAEELTLKLFTVVHAGTADHRVAEATGA